MPKVSILTALYNHEKYISKAIESVLGQTFSDWELLLWDDGSKDKSLVIAREYAARFPDKIFVYTHEGGANRGQETTRNKALEKARGDFVALLDSDDFYHERKLERLVPLMDDSRVGLAYGEIIHFDSSTGQEFQSGARHAGANGQVFEKLLTENFIGAAATLIRKSALPSSGAFDNRYRTCGEYPLWLSIAKKWRVAYTPFAVAYWRVHGENTSVKLALEAKRELVFLFERLLEESAYAEFSSAIEREVWKRRYDYASEAYSQGAFEIAAGIFREVARAKRADSDIRGKAKLMSSVLLLGGPANQWLGRIKRKFWSFRNPRAGKV